MKRAIFLYNFIIAFIGASLGYGTAAVFFLRHPAFDVWLILAFGYAASYAVFLTICVWAFPNSVAIIISESEISGPSGKLFWRQDVFLLEKVDRRRTATPGLLQRLLGYRYIWSVDNKQIAVNLLVLRKAQINEIFQRVGCPELLL